ncbi:MAG: hypothetical protein ACFUZC_06335 [Chthoniobacteraceae bacterium]
MEQLIFVLILGALALGKHFLERGGSFGGDSPDDTPDLPQRRRPIEPRPPTAMPGSGESEEERMRRFMEALGLPQSAPPPQPKPAAQRPPEPRPAAPTPAAPTPAAQPQPQSPRPQRPNPRHLGEPYGRPMAPVFRRTKPQQQRPAPAPAPEASRPEPLREPAKITMPVPMNKTAPAMQVASLERLPDSGGAVESAAASVESAARFTTSRQGAVQTSRDIAALKRDLRDPAALRKAILLREILGPPKGLQSASGPSIFHIP